MKAAAAVVAARGKSKRFLTDRSFPQARARATYRALLDAARDVFAEKGFDSTQSPDIAGRARVSVGTFYRYFGDKRQALVEMIRAHLAEAHESVMAKLTPERFAGNDHRAAIDTVLEVLFDHVRRSPALERVFLEMALRDREVAKLHREFEALALEAIAALIGQIVPREVAPDPRAAAHVVQLAAEQVAVAQSGVYGEPRVGDRAARTALREMIHRYLFPDAPDALRRARR
jgi:AcrR family transcriptional regulator